MAGWVVVLLTLNGCTGSLGTGAANTGDSAAAELLLGAVTRSQIESDQPAWTDALGSSQPDFEASLAMAASGDGLQVTVFFGTWCSDSRRELARLWQALDEVGIDPAFELRYIAVDRTKTEPGDLVAGVELRFVPTFVVEKNGEEIGRIVESAPRGIESDLHSLLAGSISGIVTGRADLEIHSTPSGD